MIIFLYGPDDYLRKQKIDELRAGYREKKTPVLEASFDLEEDSDFQKFHSFIQSPSLFHPFRLAVLANTFRFEDEKTLIGLLNSILEDNTLVCIISEEKAPRKALAFLTQKPVLSQQFKPFTGAELTEWVKDEAKKRGVSVSSGILSYLQLNYASNLWGIITELDALALEKKGAHETLEDHDLLHADFFGLIRMLRPGAPLPQLLPALEILLDRDDPAKIFNMLAALASPNEKPLYADYDIAVKSGKLDYDTALLDAVLR